MTQSGPCIECGRLGERVADLSPGEPLYVCEEHLSSWAADAHANELRRRGMDPTVVAAYVQRVRDKEDR